MTRPPALHFGWKTENQQIVALISKPQRLLLGWLAVANTVSSFASNYTTKYKGR